MSDKGLGMSIQQIIFIVVYHFLITMLILLFQDYRYKKHLKEDREYHLKMRMEQKQENEISTEEFRQAILSMQTLNNTLSEEKNNPISLKQKDLKGKK